MGEHIIRLMAVRVTRHVQAVEGGTNMESGQQTVPFSLPQLYLGMPGFAIPPVRWRSK